MSRIVWLPTVLSVLVATLVCAEDRSANSEQRRFFESQIRPVLATNCIKCHGAKKQRGGLRLDSLDSMLRGGESGPAIVPGAPDESLLVDAIRQTTIQMPPDDKLDDHEIDALIEWVRMGAPWPDDVGKVAAIVDRREKPFTDSDRSYWAFQPIAYPKLSLANRIGNENSAIDLFVSARRSEHGLEASPPAERAILLRRIHYDLTGLPPTIDDIREYDSDSRPDAFERELDRLIASPRYGQKWSRHWLDLVRYAESDGFKQDDFRPHAWRYRDYVIDAFNQDKPYDRFILEQLAGDEIEPPDQTALIATGFLRHWIYEYNQRDVRTQWSNVLNDLTDVTADVFLGMGMSCARCHDHKYDPILQRDYYRLQAFFTPFQPCDEPLPVDEQEWIDYQARLSVWESKTQDIRHRLEQLERPYRDRVAKGAIDKFPRDIRPMLLKDPRDRNPLERQLSEFANRQVTLEQINLKMETKLSEAEKSEWLALTKQLSESTSNRPPSLGIANIVRDIGSESPATYVPSRPDRPIAPGFLSILAPEDAEVVPSASHRTTGRRTALARWLTTNENPLTSRVIVNRIWQYHFGRGFVPTASDFGRLGEPPTHPELLDWLTRRFQAADWQFKPLHRQLLLSSTYRQSSRSSNATATQIDPENRWLWRMPVRRLQAEQIRDAMLWSSGEIDFTAGGPGIDGEQPRRSIFVKVIRNRRDPLLDAFDGVDNFTSTADRNVTTTPTQALLLINGPFVLARATKASDALQRIATDDELVVALFERMLSREPNATEKSRFASYLASSPDRLAAIQDLCHILLNSSELFYVE